MTKQEAINYINQLDDNIGVFVVRVEPYDVERYLSDNINKHFNELSPKQQEARLSHMADELSELYEEYVFADDFCNVAKDYFVDEDEE